ncbi:hypothetical protein [Cellulomonas fengjieae]|uniref:Uncharacterized protein n=1 Tax=Cellulomonas fengjieae TaxID=2819978 RepID=A0ABS3SE78_9CELL|nr:hypothetical protein [Cellulomonas fengjieae]MBO3084056.1 hypothetical protein [Cellulomonas fengjieae]MBO3103695.1 hypothetical protein [Cellulomonas fengjieae]QVI64687.1 hypothetical protein KG102_10885 [Cellulomonas fengjieae]
MALLPRLRQLMRRPSSASRVGARRPTKAARRGDTLHEDALRSMLSDDPNNERAFVALAEIVRRRAADPNSDQDPLAAPVDETERQRAADLAVWALGEELAGNPRAWYPLIEVARLSVHDDHEGTVRRLTTAAERDPSGKALAAALGLLREAGMPVDALGLGVGHWRPREHDPEVARQLVLASIEAGRPLEAKQHVAALDLYPDQKAIAELRSELARDVAHAEQTIPGT